MFSHQPPGADPALIGTWSPPRDHASETATIAFATTEDRAAAERWRTELAAGHLPDPSNGSP